MLRVRKLMSFKALFSFLITVPFVISGCNYKTAKTADDSVNSALGLPAGAQPSFTQLANQILTAKCFTCHNATSKETDLSNYAAFRAALANIRTRILSNGSDHMPKNGKAQLSGAEITAIISWIDNGAPENGQSAGAPGVGNQPAADAPPVPSFITLKNNFLQAKCISCHAHEPGGKHDISDYAHFKKLAPSVQLRVLLPLNKKGHMPESDHAQLNDEELTTLVTWISEGAPEKGIGEDQNPVPTPAPSPTATPIPAPTPAVPVASPSPCPAPTPSASPAPPPPNPSPVSGSSPHPLPTVMGFDQLKAAVLQAKCLSCHDGSDPTGDADDLRAYADCDQQQAYATGGQRDSSAIAEPSATDGQ